MRFGLSWKEAILSQLQWERGIQMHNVVHKCFAKNTFDFMEFQKRLYPTETRDSIVTFGKR